MADDLEEFLQRAAQRRKKRPPKIVVLEPTPVEPEVVASPPPISRPPLRGESGHTEPVRAEPVRAEVASRKPSYEPETRVEQADNLMEAHLHEVFDHRLGSLSRPLTEQQRDDTQVAKEPTVADEIIEMFQTPQNVRRAVLLNEILTPPAHRWK